MFTDEFEGTSAGQCHCKENVGGVRCDGCKNGYWNFTLENELGCQGKYHWIFNYRISANSFGGNYFFLKAGVWQVFKGGNYSREETILFFFNLEILADSNSCRNISMD